MAAVKVERGLLEKTDMTARNRTAYLPTYLLQAKPSRQSLSSSQEKLVGFDFKAAAKLRYLVLIPPIV